MQPTAATAVHGLLYLGLIAHPLVGWLAASAYAASIPVFGLFTVPPLMEKERKLSAELYEFRELFALLFIAVVVVHALIKRDDVRRGRLGGGG